jgi:hypothetical protein
MVEIQLYPWADTTDPTSGIQSMPIYKRGMIESINVNYTPTGLSLFDDDNPVFVIFSFLFQEIEVFTANDFGAGSFDVTQILDKGQTDYNNLKGAAKGASSILGSVKDSVVKGFSS